MKFAYGALAFVLLSLTLAISWTAFVIGWNVAQYLNPKELLVPKFTNNQCFVKGLREPWDADVAGIVVRKGYTKYLVMYASEADRRTLTKQGWEEDIRQFDEKYIFAPCPESWLTHRRSN